MDCRYELHMHTTASDGMMTPDEAVRIAAKRGLKGIAVTDHNTFRGSLLAARAAPQGFPVVYGNEVRTSRGDVLMLCPEKPPRELDWRGMEPQDLRDVAESWNCILVAAHPFHLGRSSVGGYAFTSRIFHAVEVWNARGPPVLNLPAIVLARRHGVPATSGSDAHVPGEVGVAPVVLDSCPESAPDIVEHVRRGLARPVYAVPGPRAVLEAAMWGLRRRRARLVLL